MSFRLSASYVSKAHTICASAAFLSALIIASRLHYRKVVKNEVAGYPDEWWPSVSATIGDWYPERSVFQILIALTAGPRFMLIFCWWLLTRSTASSFPTLVAISGVVRTFSCGGWVYITSSDDHVAHDILMISYMILNLPWMIGSILCTPKPNTVTRRHRFFLLIVPMVYLFIQHKVQRVPGAYTKYSLCEWLLILADVWFDSITAKDFSVLEVRVEIRRTVITLPTKEIEPQPSTPKSVSPAVPQTESKKRISSNDASASFLDAFHWRFSLLTGSAWRPVYTFGADVYLAYVWWTIFTSLAPSLFYFSVWQLSISGQEISLISTLSPVFLGVGSVRAVLNTRSGRTGLQALSIVGLIAYKLEDPSMRLFAVSIANISGSLLKAVEWSEPQNAERNGIVLVLGLIISSLSKLVNNSVNPTWPIVDGRSGGWNKTGLFIAMLAIWEYATRDSLRVVLRCQKAPAPSDKLAGSASEVKDTSTHNSSQPAELTSGPLSHWSLPTIGLGGLIFSLHCLFTDSGTIIANSWSGYPVTGPQPGLHGYLTLIALSLGVLIPCSNVKTVVFHPLWMALGALSTYIMYKWQDWPGYIAGLFLAIFLSSLVPGMINIAAVHGTFSPGKVYVTTWLVVCILYLADIWTVAYAFVPAGWILRERTDVVLTMQVATLGLGFIPVWRQLPSPLLFSSVEPAFGRQVRHLLAMSILASFLATTAWLPTQPPMPHHSAERLITAGIWTVHFGIDNAGRESQYRMRDLIKDMELDVVGLLETDLQRVVFGNRDLTRVIAQDLGYYVDIGPGPNSHTWGAVLLSKFPILKSTHHLLPSPHGELAPAISAVLDVWGQNITVVVSHNGQEEDALDRELQSTELARLMADTYPTPVLFLGYVVTKPLAARPNPYEILVTDGLVHDIDEEDWDRWCEYILYRGLYRVSYARVSRSTITDTELQVGKFVVPKIGHPVVNASREDRYLRTFRETLPTAMWFPDDFLVTVNPDGVRGHFYHVHTWPLYYNLPPNAVV
ncbi:hypothetical protein K439DRAFT_1334281 [Ramaria rubella]|nr:hypothetical protein K439DRAFT_1334281 [Ramaria rubella]